MSTYLLFFIFTDTRMYRYIILLLLSTRTVAANFGVPNGDTVWILGDRVVIEWSNRPVPGRNHPMPIVSDLWLTTVESDIYTDKLGGESSI